MTITPTLAGSKWYLFDQDPVESDAGIAYKRTYGYNYGRQLVNTNYNFDNNTTNLLDNSVFKSGIMVREKDKYFAMPYRDAPIYAWNGMKYSLFAPGENGWDDVEIEIPTIKLSNSVDINSLGLRGYDCMTKLQCHSDDNSGTDGAGVLPGAEGFAQIPGRLRYPHLALRHGEKLLPDPSEKNKAYRGYR